MRPLVLGLGNELLSDDGIGIHVVRQLRGDLTLPADVVECDLTGLALLDVLTGYERAIIIDAVQSGRCAPGTIIELDPENLRPALNASPHYSGLPEMMAIARQLDLIFPRVIKIYGIEIGDGTTIAGGICQAVLTAGDEVLCRVRKILDAWSSDPADAAPFSGSGADGRPCPRQFTEQRSCMN